MKNKTVKKVLALALAGIMTAGMLAGCGSKPAESTTASQAEVPAAEESAGSSEASSEAVSTAAESEGMTPFTENVTLKIPVYDRGVEGVPTVNDNYWTKWVQENFGDKYNITVEYVPITRTDVMTSYALLAASDDLPTMLMEYDFPKLADWANDGYLTTFNMDDFAATAPTYYNSMVENNLVDYSVMDGETYFALANRPFYNTGYTWQVFWRTDWLDQVGYDHVPVTYEEYEDALTKIKEAGLCDYPAGGTMLTGVGSDQNYGYRTYPQKEEEWAVYGDMNIPALGWDANKKLVKRENEKYNLGLIDPEYYVTDAETAKANFVNGKAAFYGGYISANMDWLTSFYENNQDATLGIQPADAVYADNAAYRSDNPFGMIVGFSSSATEDELKAAWMYLEWMSQEDVLFTLQWGVEGENYNVDAEGLPISVADYSGEYKQGYNNNKDYWAVVREGRSAGTMEQIIKATLPQDLPQDFTQEVLDFYNTRVKMADEGLAIIDAVYSVVLESESEYRGTLGELYKEYRDQLTMCAPEEFDALYDELTQKYLDAGYQAILDERLEQYQAGNTTKLQQ